MTTMFRLPMGPHNYVLTYDQLDAVAQVLSGAARISRDWDSKARGYVERLVEGEQLALPVEAIRGEYVDALRAVNKMAEGA